MPVGRVPLVELVETTSLVELVETTEASTGSASWDRLVELVETTSLVELVESTEASTGLSQQWSVGRACRDHYPRVQMKGVVVVTFTSPARSRMGRLYSVESEWM